MARATVRPTRNEKLRGLAAKGLSKAEAARVLGVSRQRVSQLSAQLGLTFGPRYPPVPAERLKELAKSGLTKREVARRLGLSPERLRKIAADLGISFLPPLRRPKAAATALGRVVQAARLACGYSFPRLAALSGLHRGHVMAIERGLVRCPTEKTLRALANCLASHTSYDELLGVLPKDHAVLEQRLEELAKKGLSRTEASRELGVSGERVRRIAAKLHLSFTPFRREPKAPSTEFGRMIQRARLASGYSYSRLAALSGLDRHRVIDLELGRVRHPREKTIRALADCLDGQALYDQLMRAVHGTATSVRRGTRSGDEAGARGRGQNAISFRA